MPSLLITKLLVTKLLVTKLLVTKLLMTKKSLALVAMLATLSYGSLAQDSSAVKKPEVSFNGMIRYRAELDGRFFDLGARPLQYHLLKTQIGATVRLSTDISIVAKLQDARNFGEEISTFGRGTLDGNAQSIGLREAYGKWNNIAIDGLDLVFGRMVFQTNNERLIGALDWNNIGRSYDGITLGYRIMDGMSARAFAFRLGSDELIMTPAQKQDPQSLRGIDLNLPWQDLLNLYVYNDVNTRSITGGVDSGANSLGRGTVGIYLKNAIGGLGYETEIAHQFGARKTTDSTARVSINANLLSAYLSYKVAVSLTVGLGCDYYSGDDPGTAGYEGFDHLFVTAHKFYGFMDFFPSTVLPTSGQRKSISGTQSGLLMPYILSTFVPTNDLKLQLWAMMFKAQQDIPNSTSKELGFEFDLNAYYTIMKFAKVECGLSAYLPGEAIKQTNRAIGMGTDIAYWAYTMITMSF